MEDKEKINKLIGKRLTNIRKIYGLSINELAKKSKVNKNTIIKIERGQTNSRLSTITKLANAMKHPTYDFFNF